MNLFSYIFIAFLLVSLGFGLWLNFRQQRHIFSHRLRVPADFAAAISLNDHQRAAAYSIDKLQFARVEMIFNAVILLWFTIGGGFGLIDEYWRGFGLSAIVTGILVIFSIGLLSYLLALPFSWISTFKIEEKHGFNRSTVKLFVVDNFKSAVLALIIGVPLIFLILWLMEISGGLWWLWVWLVWFGFSLVMMWLYPVLIAPWFNEFKPLEQEELVSRINALLKRTGFISNGIFIMDGSKRSGHGNAYFSGFGKSKRIVFFDTLLDSLSPPEVEAVLAHELGHFKKNHIKKNLILMGLLTLAGLAVLGFLIRQEWFFNGLGAEQSTYMALILFFAAAPAFTFFITPLISWFSRKHEYEADSFAVANASGAELISALVTLYKDNAGTLTPDPWYSLVFDSHPPAPLRVEFIKQETGL